MYYFSRNYQKYDNGGLTGGVGSSQTTLNSAMGIGQGVSGIMDSVWQEDAYGRKPVGASVASDALKGASIGMAAGPIGAAVGAVGGAAYGFFSQRSRNASASRMQAVQQRAQDAAIRTRSQAVIAQNPELTQGNVGAGYYAAGGPLSSNYLSRSMMAEGGSLTPMSSDTAQVNGPSHEEGGVQLPGTGAEVEGGESLQNNFVFSERLGFAQEHKRLSKAIGKIEDKGAQTPEKVNAISRMKDRQQKLMLAQEYAKHVMSTTGPAPVNFDQQSPQ